MMLEHPKIVPRSRKTLDFSRVGVAWGGSAFHHVVALVQVVVEMYKRPEGGSGGAQGGSLEGAKRELREAARGQLEVASSSRGGRSSSCSSSTITQDGGPRGTCNSNPTLAPLEPEFGPLIGGGTLAPEGPF